MADSVNPANCPPGYPLYLGYVDGNWPSYRGLVQRFPNAIVVACTVNPNHDMGTVLDVEQGDATPQQAPPWVLKRRAASVDPTVYCSLSAWPTVRAAFRSAGVAEPHYLVAGYANPPDATIPAGAVGHQFIDHGPYDESVVADFWPGVDPVPSPPSGRVKPMYNPPLTDIVASTPCPSGGSWLLKNDGAIFAIDGAPYAGGANGKPYFAGRTGADFAPLNDAERAAGKLYVILSEQPGGRYAYPE